MEIKDIRNPVPTIYGDWITRFGETWKSQLSQIQSRFGGRIEETRMPGEHPIDVPIVYVQKDSIIDLLSFLKTEPGFEYGFLSDITAIDEMDYAEAGEPRFEVVYNLYSMSQGCRLRVKARVQDGEPVPTATVLWPAANWAEREVFDMFGLKFKGHPDLRRILMDHRTVGHPLRKDYPLRGYQVFTSPEPIDPKLLDD